MDNEITIKINMTKYELDKVLLQDGFSINKESIMDDIYFIKSSDIITKLNNYILLRRLDNKLYLVHKKKEYFDNEILNQSKDILEINNKEEGIKFINSFNYQESIHINTIITIYQKNDLFLCVQEVNNKFLLMEIEYSNKYNSKEIIIKEINKLNIKYDKSNYFVNKAKIVSGDDLNE